MRQRLRQALLAFFTLLPRGRRNGDNNGSLALPFSCWRNWRLKQRQARSSQLVWPARQLRSRKRLPSLSNKLQQLRRSSRLAASAAAGIATANSRIGSTPLTPLIAPLLLFTLFIALHASMQAKPVMSWLNSKAYSPKAFVKVDLAL
jgi:hypothetical protein